MAAAKKMTFWVVTKEQQAKAELTSTDNGRPGHKPAITQQP